MAINYYQIGPDVLKSQYTGEDSVESLYEGTVITKPTSVAMANTDTLEIVICEVPAGVVPFGIMWAISASIAAASLTAKFAFRSKSNNAVTNQLGNTGQFGDANTSGGVISITYDVPTIPMNGTAIAINGNVQGSTTLIPTLVEGLTPAKPTLQQSYYLSLVLTASGAVTIPAGVTIWAGIEGKFIGNA